MEVHSLMEKAAAKWMPTPTSLEDIISPDVKQTVRRLKYQIRRKHILMEAHKMIVKALESELLPMYELKKELEIAEKPTRVIFPKKRKSKLSSSSAFDNLSEADVQIMLESGELEKLIKEAVAGGQC